MGVITCCGLGRASGVIILEVGGVTSPLAAPLASGPGVTWASDDAVGGVGDDVVGWIVTWWYPGHCSTQWEGWMTT